MGLSVNYFSQLQSLLLRMKITVCGHCMILCHWYYAYVQVYKHRFNPAKSLPVVVTRMGQMDCFFKAESLIYASVTFGLVGPIEN